MSPLDLPDDATVTLTVRQLKEMLGPSFAVDRTDERSTLPMTVEQVAEAVGKSPSTVRGWLSSGELEGFKLESGAWRCRSEALDAFFARAEEHHAQLEDADDPDSVDLGSWRTGRAS